MTSDQAPTPPISTTSAASWSAAPAGDAVRRWLGIGGLIALVTGIVLVLWPARSAVAVTIILAIYAIIAGIVYLVIAVTERGLRPAPRVIQAVAGVLYILAGVIALMNPATAATALAIIVVTMIGIAWIFEGVASLTTLSMSRSKGWTVFFAVVSVIAGIALLFAPIVAALAIALWLGISLIAIGVFGIIRAITFNRAV